MSIRVPSLGLEIEFRHTHDFDQMANYLEAHPGSFPKLRKKDDDDIRVRILAKANHLTICQVVKTESFEQPKPIMAEGAAACSVLDTFNREVGRKAALTKAVAPLPRAVRTAIWQAYMNRKPTGQVGA